MGKDLLGDEYGRFWNIPLELARLGHSVTGCCLSYQHCRTQYSKNINEFALTWRSVNVGLFKPFGPAEYCRMVLRAASTVRPDIILTFSDSIYAILGAWLAPKVKSKLVVDCYDNFESYASAKIPFVLPLFKHVIRKADAVTTNSQILAHKILSEYAPQGPVRPIENGVDSKIFFPQDRNQARESFRLPREAILIGTAGALHRNRGMEILFKGFEKLSAQYPNLHLVLAGAREPRLQLPDHSHVHYLGMLPLDKIPQFISMLDLAVICNKPSKFGNYCFPQKVYEILACKVPLLAARVGAIVDLLKDHQRLLFEPDNLEDFIEKSKFLIDNPEQTLNIEIQTWAGLAKKMENLFFELLAKPALKSP